MLQRAAICNCLLQFADISLPFAALWNPRLIEVNPLLVDIENYLNILRPDIIRVSSGKSGITDVLTNKLWDCDLFDDIVYIEGRHIINMPIDRYIGAWKSVNDIRVQLGDDKFNEFILYIEDKTKDLNNIEATYLTRAWSARRKE